MARQTFRTMSSHLLTQHNFKVVILLVSTWIFVTLLSSFDTKNGIKSPQPSIYYYTSSNTGLHENPPKSNNVQIDTSLVLEALDIDEDLDSDIFNYAKQASPSPKDEADNNKNTAINLVTKAKSGNSILPEYKFETAKKILYFTSYFGMHDWNFGFGNQPFLDHNCPVTNCYITNKRDNMSISQFDAVLFHIRDMGGGHTALPNHKKRLPHQRYVMFLMESPKNDGFPYEKFGNFFNWTMTFRLDSDFPNPYGWVEPINNPLSVPTGINDLPDLTFDTQKRDKITVNFIEDLRQKTSKKQKLVAWMVSNCGTHSQREDYVKELQKHISVDIYGGCGKFKCKKVQNDANKCLEHLDENYKFYLSFENSVCNDYVTEKFWNPLSLSSILPIVLGAGNYSKIAPTKSFIDAHSFESPAKLAEHLLYLDQNFDEYSKYFLWKTKFRVKHNEHNVALCKVCAELNNESIQMKSYSNMNTWWRDQGQCKSKGDFPWSPQESPFSFESLLDDASKTLIDGAQKVLGTINKIKIPKS